MCQPVSKPMEISADFLNELFKYFSKSHSKNQKMWLDYIFKYAFKEKDFTYGRYSWSLPYYIVNWHWQCVVQFQSKIFIHLPQIYLYFKLKFDMAHLCVMNTYVFVSEVMFFRPEGQKIKKWSEVYHLFLDYSSEINK